MKIVLNNKEREVHSHFLTEILTELQIETKGIAVGLNARVIARKDWESTPVLEGDKVVIVSAVFGG